MTSGAISFRRFRTLLIASRLIRLATIYSSSDFSVGGQARSMTGDVLGFFGFSLHLWQCPFAPFIFSIKDFYVVSHWRYMPIRKSLPLFLLEVM